MGRPFLQTIEGEIFVCKQCGSHLAKNCNLKSKCFSSRTGPAWLFNYVVNVCKGREEEKQFTTGLHLVRDLSCNSCLQIVGWKYEYAQKKDQKYKEGMFILESDKIVYQKFYNDYWVSKQIANMLDQPNNISDEECSE